MQPDEPGGVFVMGPTQPDPLMLYQLGEYHYQQGNLVEAEKAYLASGIPAAFNNLGVILHQRRDYQGCIRCWILSGNVDAINNLERLLEEQGRAQEFPAMLLKINSPAAYHRLARMHLANGNVARAEELLRISATKDAWSDLGVLLAQRGQLEEAEKCLRKGRDPFYNLGVLYWKDWKPARLADAELCFLKSGTPHALCQLGRLYELNGETSRACFKYWKSGTEKALIHLSCLYIRFGAVRDAEAILKTLFLDGRSMAAGYYLLNLYQCRGKELKPEPAVLSLPPMSAQDQLDKLGVVASLPAEYRHAKPNQCDAPPPKLESVRRQIEREARLKRLIRVSVFDDNDEERLVSCIPEDKLVAEDANVASFRLRLECNAEREDVEIVEYEPGEEEEALWRNKGARQPLQLRRQMQIRDWLITGCSSTAPGSSFQSAEPLPVDSDTVTWSLKQLVLHPGYQMQTLALTCSDGVVKRVEGGVIRPLPASMRFYPEEQQHKAPSKRGGQRSRGGAKPASGTNDNAATANKSNNNNNASVSGTDAQPPRINGGNKPRDKPKGGSHKHRNKQHGNAASAANKK